MVASRARPQRPSTSSWSRRSRPTKRGAGGKAKCPTGGVVTLAPKLLEPAPGDPGVVGGMFGIAMAEVILHGPEVGALIGKVIAAGMPKHVRPDPAELRLLAGNAHDVVDRLARQLRLTLRYEKPRQAVVARCQVALDRTQLVASDRLLDAERVLEARHP